MFGWKESDIVNYLNMVEFKKSDQFKQEYCASIIKIPEVIDIEGSDFLGKVTIDGLSLVVRKDQIKEGDVVFYAANETQLDVQFLKANNLYSDSTLNEDQTKKGYFPSNGRVRTIKLKGVQSFGYLFTLSELQKAYGIGDIELTPGTEFDMVRDVLFIKAYVPYTKPKVNDYKSTKGARKRAERIDRIIPGEFMFHYDTQLMAKNLDRLSFNDIITLTVKLHGTSFIFGNVWSNIPVKLPWYKRLVNLFHKKYPKYVEGFSEIYSSRTVIKNKWACPGGGFYTSDIYGEWAELLKGKIPEGYTIYGEIIGYLSGTSKFIQKNYDYGCRPGTSKLMIYRVSQEARLEERKIKKEWNVEDVKEFTLGLMKKYPELQDKLHPIDILYHGPLSEFAPLDRTQHWQENFLKAIQEDEGDEELGMEKDEPLCKNKVPREGVVLRIDNDPMEEAFKVKCQKFLTREAKEIDKGNVDMEMSQGYGNDTL